MLTKDDLQAIIDGMSPLIDARARTTEIFVKAEIREAKEALHAEIQDAKQELRKEIHSIKENLEEEILISRAEAKIDHLNLGSKIDPVIKDHKRRIETLEETTNTPNSHKH